MAGQPQSRPEIRRERAHRADGGEPYNDETMNVRRDGGSLVVGLTAFAASFHSIDESTVATVECYDDGVWVDFGGGQRDE